MEKGWQNFKEINRVFYDPDIIDIGEMQSALERAGTFLGIAE